MPLPVADTSRSCRVAVLNAGGWGTALATLLANAGQEVSLWCRRPELADQIVATGENKDYLPGVSVPPNVLVTARMEAALVGAELVILAPISRALRETIRAAAPFIAPSTLLLQAAKGFEGGTLMSLTHVVRDELPPEMHAQVAALSGPNHAEEVARGFPSAAVVACEDHAVATRFQDLLHGTTFRVYTSTDVVGVELCGALKNVLALATGGADGLGFGDNTRAALITRGLAEIGRLVAAAGGDPRTIAGLAGLGDVVATCTSRHSRNRWAGEQIGRGRPIAEILASTRQVIEGVPAARVAVELAARYGVEVPICEQVYRVVDQGAPIRDVLLHLMGREAKEEF